MIHTVYLSQYAFDQQMSAIYTEAHKRYSFTCQQCVPYLCLPATHFQLGIPMQLRIMLNPPSELVAYLKKLKEQKNEGVAKIFEVCEEADGLLVASELCTLGTLGQALARCHKLQDSDCLFVGKLLLQAHVQLLRAGLQWFGSEDDIDFTDNGIKLSWNNSIAFTNDNPLPHILARLAGYPTSTSNFANTPPIMPVLKNKAIESLVGLSRRNATEISADPNMKRREKQSKKRGRSWVALRETRNDFQYYEESVFLALHAVGFVRVKVYSQGRINQQLMKCFDGSSNFVKVIETSEEGGKPTIVSEYSNEGNVANYFTKLKSNNLTLNEAQIQFISASLFEPLQKIQDSPLKCIGTLHIKNIYLEDGIVKIGEPVPMSPNIQSNLKFKSQVPDFFHRQFKSDPKSIDPSYDTYSVGVLLYKLMYQEYPIFPQNKVHIPTAPSYSQRLKNTLRAFLDEGGLIKNIIKRIQLSEEVLLQLNANKKNKKQNIYEDKQSLHQVQQQKQHSYIQDDNNRCWGKGYALTLDTSPYRTYRMATKIIFILVFYLLVFYFYYLKNTFVLMTSNLKMLSVTITTVIYNITVADETSFYRTFNQTNGTLTALQNQGCFIDGTLNSLNYPVNYSSFGLSPLYTAYVVMGFIIILLMLLLKSCFLYRLDIIRCSTMPSKQYPRCHFVLAGLLFASLLNNHFLCFGQIWSSTINVCLGSAVSYGSTQTFYSNTGQFYYVFVAMLSAALLLQLVQLIILKADTFPYSKLCNPIFLFGPLWVVYVAIVRVGLFDFFTPSYKNGFKTSYPILLALIPQIMVLGQWILQIIIDLVHWGLLDKKRMQLVHDMSTAQIMPLH